MTSGTATGTLTGSSAYDLEAGTVSMVLGGTVGLNKTTPGTVTFTKAPPNGPYTHLRRHAGAGHVVEDDVLRLADDVSAAR